MMVKLNGCCRISAALFVLLLIICWISSDDSASEAAEVSEHQQKVYTETFRSQSFSLGPGDVVDEFFSIAMPQGHIALRSFDAQVVDEHGFPVPLHETYLHHWIVERLHIVKGSSGKGREASQRVLVPNAGVCLPGQGLAQLYGLGSETRRTNTTVPPPYGIVIGDPHSIPAGFEETWVLNVHAIDTRGAIDPRGCTECVCALYNVTTDRHGVALPPAYEGGLQCCRDRSHCAVREGFEGVRRNLSMEYTVTWVDMTEDVVPVKVYILDVTDGRTSMDEKPTCKVEYTVQKCAAAANEYCHHTFESYAFLPEDGDVVYAVAHQHSGGIGASLHNEDGDEICSSFPVYGQGSAAGNEAGYIVGMSTCYPKPGTVRIKTGEKLVLKSFYDNEQRHTGVMGLFYLLVAPPSPPLGGGYLDYHSCLLMALNVTVAVLVMGPILACIIRLHKKRGWAGYQQIHDLTDDSSVQHIPTNKLSSDQSVVPIPTS